MQLDYHQEELKLEQGRETDLIILRQCLDPDILIQVKAYSTIWEELSLDQVKDIKLQEVEVMVQAQDNILFMIEMLELLRLILWKEDMIERELVKLQAQDNITLA